MPAAGRVGAFLLRQICYVGALLSSSQCRSFTAIETHRYNFKLFAGSERHDSECADHTVEDLVAKHWAFVENQRQHHRLVAEIFSQCYCLTVFVSKLQIERQLFM